MNIKLGYRFLFLFIILYNNIAVSLVPSEAIQ